MKIIIVGIGKVGLALVKELSAEKHEIVVIDEDPAAIRNVVNIYDVIGIVGNGASYQAQTDAGVPDADLLVAMTNLDELNILCCLLAKKLGVNHTIARIRNPEYGKQLRFMRNELGLSLAVNPEQATAREIARILRFPSAVKIESFSKGRIEMAEYRLGDSDPLNGIRLSELYKSIRVKVLVCAVCRDEKIIIPSGDFILRAEDRIYVTASPAQLEQFFRNLGIFKRKASSVMIVGASQICHYLAQELSDMKMELKIIDQDEKRCIKMGEQFPKAIVIVGDGTDNDLLTEEGIQNTDAFVALSGMDEANILMALNVASLHSCKVIAKINRRSLANLVSKNHMIDSIVSTGVVTTELIVQYIRAMQNTTGSQIKTLHRIVDESVEALEFTVTKAFPYRNTPLKDLPLKNGLLIAGIVRQNGTIVIPSGQDMLYENDDVIVVTTDTSLKDLNDILKKGGLFS